MTDPPRLLFVVNVAWFFLSHRLQLAIAARNSGWQVHVAAGDATAEEIRLIELAGLHFHGLDVKRSSRNPLRNFALLVQLIKLYRKVRPMIAHHVTIKPVMLGTLAARIARVPVVVNAVSGLGYAFSSTNSGRKALRALVGLAYRACLNHPHMTVIFQNRDDRADFSRWTGLLELPSVLIPGSGVDISRYQPTPEPAGNIRVTLPARMLRDKGVVEFATAIGTLRQRGMKIEGLLAGATDPDNPESLTEVELHGLEASYGVQWLKHCDDMPGLFAQTHIVCLPSYREGLPKALIEAAAAGRAIVTTDVPGCRAVVQDGVTGILVQARQSLPVADAIERLARDAQLRLRYARAARLRAENEFSYERIIDATLELYQQMSRPGLK